MIAIVVVAIINNSYIQDHVAPHGCGSLWWVCAPRLMRDHVPSGPPGMAYNAKPATRCGDAKRTWSYPLGTHGREHATCSTRVGMKT